MQEYEIASIFYHRAIELSPYEIIYYSNKLLALIKLEKIEEAE